MTRRQVLAELDRLERAAPKVVSQWRMESLSDAERRTVRGQLNASERVSRAGGRVWGSHREGAARGCRCAQCTLVRATEGAIYSWDALQEARLKAPQLARELGWPRL